MAIGMRDGASDSARFPLSGRHLTPRSARRLARARGVSLTRPNRRAGTDIDESSRLRYDVPIPDRYKSNGKRFFIIFSVRHRILEFHEFLGHEVLDMKREALICTSYLRDTISVHIQ